MERYNEEFLRLYDNKEEIPDFILRQVLCNNRIIAEEFGENRRWTRSAVTVIEIPTENETRLFAIDWEEGLTEYQENIYWSATEVEVQMDMQQLKLEVATTKYIDKRTGDVAAVHEDVVRID